jgi:DNA polymerase-3 subunit beta
MRVTCLQENLSRGLALVSRAVATRSTLPVLSNVLLQSEDGGLRLSGMNQQLAMSVWLGASVEDDGAITVPARLLSDFVAQLPEGPVTLVSDDETDSLSVASGRFQAKLKGLSAEDFPPIPTTGDEREVDLATDLLGDVIGQVVTAAATDDSRPVLAGVSITIAPDHIELAAADGYRLAVRREEVETGLAEAVQIVVPRPAMVELQRMLADDPGTVTIGLSETQSQVLFRTSTVTFIATLIDGQFPNYPQLIPGEVDTRVVVTTLEFAKATRIASLFASSGANVIKLHVQPGADGESGRVVLTSNSAELGENSGELDAEVSGDGGLIAFNPRFLSECLGSIATERISVGTSGATSPGRFRPVDGDEEIETHSHVIMPMHTVS